LTKLLPQVSQRWGR